MNESQLSKYSNPAFHFEMAQERSEAGREPEPHSISREVLDFISEEIGSIEQLEILLHLFRDSDKWWTTAEVYDLVKSSLGSVQERLTRFTHRDILQKNGCDPPCYRFNQQSEKRARVLSELDSHYRERRVRIVELIYSQLPSGPSEFARAFRIRKD